LSSYPGGKRPEHWGNHSSPSSVEVKNAWSVTSTSLCFHVDEVAQGSLQFNLPLPIYTML
jgi:hypothetical protein